MDHQLHTADTHCPKLEATNVQHVKSNLVTLPDLAEQILDWRSNIRKHEGRRARALDAHLVLFGARSQSRLPFDDERAEFIAINFGENDEDVGEAAVGDPHLLAVENVFLAVVTQTCCS